MQSLAMLLAFLSDDARLDAKASLDAPRLTYAEFGAWAAKATGVPVTVPTAIRERKLTVLVENRPVREIMDRVAEALFLEWERTKDGYTLRLPSKVRDEEARIAADDAAAVRQGALDALERLGHYGEMTAEDLQARIDGAKAEEDAAKRDPSPAGKAAAESAGWRRGQLESLKYNSSYQAGASVLAQLSPEGQASILDGATVYASTKPEKGFLSLPDSSLTALAKNNGMLKPGDRVLFAIRYDAAKGELTFENSRHVDENGGSGFSQSLKGSDEAGYRAAMRDEPLRARLVAWAKTDPETLATRLAPRKPAPEVERPTPYRALAEILVELHARAGLPIVADGFRTAVVGRGLPDGATLDLWNRSLSPWSDYRFRGYRPLLRTSGGWALFRHPQYWKMLPREVPEAPIRALEAVWARPGRATLDDYAAFAGHLTPAQTPWIDGSSLVMEVPYQPLAGNVPFLRLWDALSSGQRRSAQTPEGLELRAMDGDARRLYLACFDAKRGTTFGSDADLAYWLPGGSPLPNDLRLKVDPRAQAMPIDEVDASILNRTHGYRSDIDSVPAVSAELGPPGRWLQYFSVPLRGPVPERETR